ncbi:unnamed protein product [Lota lota]
MFPRKQPAVPRIVLGGGCAIGPAAATYPRLPAGPGSPGSTRSQRAHLWRTQADSLQKRPVVSVRLRHLHQL